MKIRADKAVFDQQLTSSREQARLYILAGLVHSDHELIDKPGQLIDVNTKLYVKKQLIPYVSRGGIKLEHALVDFDVSVVDKVVLDIGSSTGGFSDCCLQGGAKKVYAVDVTNHLDYKLQQNSKVVMLGGVNFRYLPRSAIAEQVNLVVIDVSFISLKLIFANLINFLDDDSEIIALIKPQFEAGKEEVGKKGVVKDQAVLIKTINKVIADAIAFDLVPVALTFSKLKGKKEGNIEFFIYLRKSGTGPILLVEKVVKNAYNYFKEKGKDQC